MTILYQVFEINMGTNLEDWEHIMNPREEFYTPEEALSWIEKEDFQIKFGNPYRYVVLPVYQTEKAKPEDKDYIADLIEVSRPPYYS